MILGTTGLPLSVLPQLPQSMEAHYMACAGQPRDQAQKTWIYKRQVLLDQPDLLL